jgi:hypothetical protein
MEPRWSQLPSGQRGQRPRPLLAPCALRYQSLGHRDTMPRKPPTRLHSAGRCARAGGTRWSGSAVNRRGAWGQAQRRYRAERPVAWAIVHGHVDPTRPTSPVAAVRRRGHVLIGTMSARGSRHCWCVGAVREGYVADCVVPMVRELGLFDLLPGLGPLIGSVASMASFASISSLASAGSLGSVISAASLLSYQSAGSALSLKGWIRTLQPSQPGDTQSAGQRPGPGRDGCRGVPAVPVAIALHRALR